MGQIDFKNLSPEEKAICYANFLKPKDVLEQLILEYRNGIKAQKKQAYYEKQQAVREVVTDLNTDSIKEFSVQNDAVLDIAATSIKVMQHIENIVNNNIAKMSEDPNELEALASSLGCKRLFAKAYKEDATSEDMQAFATELHNRVYPEGIKDVIKQAMQYTSTGNIIDGKDVAAVKQALNNSICMLLQLSTKGNITAFICTNNYREIENLYGQEYYVAALTYATKHTIMEYENGRKERPDINTKPNLHKVLSGSLRIRKAIKDAYDLSSTTYNYNENNCIACIELDNPTTLGNQLQTSLNEAVKLPSYQLLFDMNMFDKLSNNPTLDTAVSIVSVATGNDVNSISALEDKVVFWEGIKRRGYLSNL